MIFIWFLYLDFYTVSYSLEVILETGSLRVSIIEICSKIHLLTGFHFWPSEQSTL